MESNEEPTLQNRMQYKFGQIYNWMALNVPLLQNETDKDSTKTSVSDFLYNTASKVYQMVINTPDVEALGDTKAQGDTKSQGDTNSQGNTKTQGDTKSRGDTKAQSDKKTTKAMPPWSGYENEQKIKEQCLSLTLDRRNFIKAPPDGVEFSYDHNVHVPVAQAALESDENLVKIRYKLVPCHISEENFWRNYFYRVWLICKAEEQENLDEELDVVIKEKWVEDLELELRELEENEPRL